MLLAHADGARGREALKALEFYAQSVHEPHWEMADIVLPVASAFGREGLKIGFEIREEAQSLVQLRPAVVAPAER
jgi:anaerobic selenocysteine-containing dehydrogenase